ncbi:MAG TPA: hypothetical protein VH914_03765 [Acidimicrobiia bacterium]|jgi:hypothetical protein|nr:hypothetical protein [Acidimicrobiia bacterium]
MRLTVEVPLHANRADVWAAMSSVGGVNRELSPFVRMTDSTHGAHFDTEPWRVGTPVGWQLLLGFIPIDRHRIDLVALPDGGGFRESSSTWWYRVWRHERTLLDHPDGCVVHDDIEMESRFGMPDAILQWAVSWMFERRYEHLRRQFG